MDDVRQRTGHLPLSDPRRVLDRTSDWRQRAGVKVPRAECLAAARKTGPTSDDGFRALMESMGA